MYKSFKTIYADLCVYVLYIFVYLFKVIGIRKPTKKYNDLIIAEVIRIYLAFIKIESRTSNLLSPLVLFLVAVIIFQLNMCSICPKNKASYCATTKKKKLFSAFAKRI